MRFTIIMITLAIGLFGCSKKQSQDNTQETSIQAPHKIIVGMNSAEAVQLIKKAKWKVAPIPYEPEKQGHSYQAYSNGDELLILLYDSKTKIIEKLEYQKTSEAPTEVITEYIIQQLNSPDKK